LCSHYKYKENSNLVFITKFDNRGGGVYDISSVVENYVLGITQQTGGLGAQIWYWDTPGDTVFWE